MRRFVEDLKKDSAALYLAALRQQVRAALPDDFKAADYSARAIRRRLAASEFTERHLRFTDNFLDRLEAEVLPEAPSLRKQAWWLDVSAELVNVWTATYERRRDELAAMVREARQPSTSTRKARGPSVGLDCFISNTLECSTADIAEKLMEADVFPERENDENDPIAQWKETLRRARQRYRTRYGIPGTQPAE